GDSLGFTLSFIGLALLLKKGRDGILYVIAALLLIVNVKANFIVIAALFPLVWYAWPASSRPPLSRLLLWGGLALPLVLYRRIFNYFDMKAAGTTHVQLAYERLLQNTDITAFPYSVPRANYERVLAGMDRYDWNVLAHFDWYYSSVRSFFGKFGYMNFDV